MRDIFAEIERERVKITGWCSAIKARALAASVIALQPELTIEIGVWAGKSCIPLCMAHREIGRGKVWAIDPWDAKESSEGQENSADRAWWSEQGKHEFAFKEFNKTLDALALDPFVRVFRAKSDDVAPIVPVQPQGIGILSLDGNHGKQAITDAKRYGSWVRRGGLVFVDDVGWSGGHVKKAITELILIGFHELYAHNDAETANTWACYQRL